MIRFKILLLLFVLTSCNKKDVNLKFADNPPLEDFVFDIGDNEECVKYVYIHTTASRDGVCWTEADFNVNWKNRGFSRPGYHLAINPKESCGIVKQGRFGCSIKNSEGRWGVSGYDKQGKRYNYVSLHIAWIGGYDGTDTRTDYQKRTLHLVVSMIKDMCPNVIIVGHNQVANNSCPNFDVSKEFQYLNN